MTVTVCNKKPMSEGQARNAALRINQKPGQKRTAFPVFCAACNVWHVTTG